MRYWLGGRFGWVALAGILVSLGVGISGLPGEALAALTSWLDDTGKVELHGPVGDAVRRAL